MTDPPTGGGGRRGKEGLAETSGRAGALPVRSPPERKQWRESVE
jgi:hypothetical protein